MGCFLGCFGGQKSRRRRVSKDSEQAEPKKLSLDSAKTEHLNGKVSSSEEILKSSVAPVTETYEEAGEKCSTPSSKKSVTFDTKVKTFQQETVELLEVEKEEVKPEEKSLSSSKTGHNSEVPSGTYPSSHRYKNCRESDDDDEVEEGELYSDDVEDDEEYYSDDGFDEEIDSKLRRSNESVGDGNHYAHGVLNPVENLTQWKSAKSKGKTMQKPSQKENSNLFSDQGDNRDSFSFGAEPQIHDAATLASKSKCLIEPKKPKNEELTVDASLSTWLSTSETESDCNSVSITPEKKSSRYSKQVIYSHDDRPILCALSLEEIRQFSATSTPRKSPSKSTDETPIIGTVGGYWSSSHSKAIDCGSDSSFKGIPNTTSKYREDKSVNWHSTPFEARLEKALNNKE